MGDLPLKLEGYVAKKTVLQYRSEFVEHYAVFLRSLVPDGQTNRVDYDALARSVSERHKEFLNPKHPTRSHVSIYITQLRFKIFNTNPAFYLLIFSVG